MKEGLNKVCPKCRSKNLTIWKEKNVVFCDDCNWCKFMGKKTEEKVKCYLCEKKIGKETSTRIIYSDDFICKRCMKHATKSEEFHSVMNIQSITKTISKVK